MVETFAGHFKASLTLLHVVEPIMYTNLPVDATSIAEEQLNAYLPDRFQDCDMERVLLFGDAAHRVVDYAHQGRFNLIMLPTHGYGRFRRFILGSVAAKILHDARSRIPKPRDPRLTAGHKSTPKRRSRTCSRLARSTPRRALFSPAPSPSTASGRTRSSPRPPSPRLSPC